MKKERKLIAFLILIIAAQAVFILSSFSKNEAETPADARSYQIERTYVNGKYFYVLVSNGEAKAFMRD